ncbi:MAG: Hsp20 family protein [Alphaproteobacteria bacterium]
MRSTYDFSPLFRTSVGFDRFDQLFDSALRASEQVPSYPPYNIERLGENDYQISIALAGFTENELEIMLEKGVLTVKSKDQPQGEQANTPDRQFLHRGIAKRAFERRFQLDDNVKVTGADLVNGLLVIDLVREVPESQKPREITIGGQPKLQQSAA